MFLSDHALDHAHVAPAPQQEALVELDEFFEEKIEIVIFGFGVDAAKRLDQLGAGVDDREAARCNRDFDPVVERRLVGAPFQPRALRVVEIDPLQHVGAPQAGGKLQLTKLHRLKTAGGVEIVAKLVELLRRHRLQNVHLLFEQALDRVDAPEVLGNPKQIVAVEGGHRCVEFVEHLFEPKLVHLMDDDEEHLVVVGRAGERLLEGEQLVDF